MTTSADEAENLSALRVQLLAAAKREDSESAAAILPVLTDALEAYGYPMLAESFRLRRIPRALRSSHTNGIVWRAWRTVSVNERLWARLDFIIDALRRGAVAPEFVVHVHDTGGMRWPTGGRIQAYVRGVRAGYLEFLLSPREATALIEMIWVDRKWRRLGIATALMDELHAANPRLTKFLTPEILPDGQPFFAQYNYQEKRSRKPS